MPALAQTSASPTVFSYQGRLLENGQPVTGLYELHFGLYDAVTDGASLGLVVDLVVVPVTNGLFVVTLDFQHQFDPQRSYFVEVGVWVQPRAGSTGFPDLQKMQPRQPILPVPLASTAAYAANAALADVATTALSAPASTNASLLSEGILPDARLDTNIVRQTNLVALQNTLLGAIAAVSNSVPSGALPSTNAALLSTGILPDARLATNIVRRTDLVALENTLLGAITAVSNSVPAISLPAGVVVASADPNDPQLTAQGLRPFASFPGASWKNGSALGEPSARVGNTAVWTGSEFVVWGGETGAGDLLNDGERYRPAQDSWGLLSPISAPARRVYHTAVWTGAEMIVWGGYGQSDDLGDGGRYHLNNQAWAPVSLTNAPTPRASHNAVWTGRRMLIWGGYSHQGHLGTGGLYDPATDSWTALPDTGAPTPRSGAAAVWTGSEFLVWGGESDFLALNTRGAAAV